MITFQHQLQQFDPGIVWLDKSNRVMALNRIASEIFGVGGDEYLGQNVLQFHPESSRDKVAWLLDSSACPIEAPPPVTMMINIPDRILLVKVSKMVGADAGGSTCMIFFDLTDVTTTPHEEGEFEGQPRLLFKLPVYKNGKVLLVDLEDVSHFKSEGHYTNVFTEKEQYLSNLSLSDLEKRLDMLKFVRIHRCHMINLKYAKYFESVDNHNIVTMDTLDKVALPVSRSKVKNLRALLGID